MDVISGPINQVGKLDARQSFINKDNPNIMVSAVKNSEKEDGVVIRMYSISDKNEEVNFTFTTNIESAYKTDYLERVLQKLEYNRNAVSLSVSPYKVATLKVSLKK
jgi:alpha-mannosidase